MIVVVHLITVHSDSSEANVEISVEDGAKSISTKGVEGGGGGASVEAGERSSQRGFFKNS